MTDPASLPDIPLVLVQSSNVESIGYDAATKTARVRFRNGATYQYADVPPEMHAQIMESNSKGAAVTQLKVFACTKEPPPPKAPKKP